MSKKRLLNNRKRYLKEERKVLDAEDDGREGEDALYMRRLRER